MDRFKAPSRTPEGRKALKRGAEGANALLDAPNRAAEGANAPRELVAARRPNDLNMMEFCQCGRGKQLGSCCVRVIYCRKNVGKNCRKILHYIEVSEDQNNSLYTVTRTDCESRNLHRSPSGDESWINIPSSPPWTQESRHPPPTTL